MLFERSICEIGCGFDGVFLKDERETAIVVAPYAGAWTS